MVRDVIVTQDDVTTLEHARVDSDATHGSGWMNAVGATPCAERSEETVAVEGRIARTIDGIRTTRGTRFGASSHVARFLLSTREHDPGLRFAANLRFDDAIERALAEIDAEVVEIDRTNEPEEEGSTMGWAAERAFGQSETTPAIVFDRGDVGKEPITRLLAKDATDPATRALSVAERV